MARRSFRHLCSVPVLALTSTTLVMVAMNGQARAADGDKPAVVKPAEGELIKPMGPSTKPAAPATKPSTKPAVEVSPEVRAVLDKVRDAYKEIKTLKVAGTITSDIDVNAQQFNDKAEFAGSFEAPLKFRHQLREQLPAGGDGKVEMRDSMLVGGTGAKIYIFEPKYKYYYLADAPKERGKAELLGKSVAPLLEQQNLSLLLAMVSDAAAELLDGVDAVAKVDDVKVGDTACPAIKFTAGKELVVTVAFDPASSLVRRVIWDRKGYAEAKKQQDVKKMLITVDYTATEVGGDLKGETFAWAAPLGARDVTALADAGAADDDDDGADVGKPNELVGKPAPDFKLKGLDGVEVKLSDLKGNVVLLDFWATWCGPCRASLPELDKIYGQFKDKGLKAFAVNLREESDEVKAFVEKTKLGIPVLLDADGKASKLFGVSGIPQTVVIGKDGKIVKIVVGSGTHEQVKKAIEAAIGG